MHVIKSLAIAGLLTTGLGIGAAKAAVIVEPAAVPVPSAHIQLADWDHYHHRYHHWYRAQWHHHWHHWHHHYNGYYR